MNKFNKLNQLLAELKDAELMHSQAIAHVAKGSMVVTLSTVIQAKKDYVTALAAFKQEKTNLMNTR